MSLFLNSAGGILLLATPLLSQSTTGTAIGVGGTVGPSLSPSRLGDCIALTIDSDERIVLYERLEADSGRDWNKDGDLLDRVLHVWDSDSRIAWNTGLVADSTRFVREGDYAVVDVSESDVDQDLDGDGFKDDLVAHVLDLGQRQVVSTAIAREVRPPIYASGKGLGFEIFGDTLLIAVSERAGYTDWLGDGDFSDVVYCLYSLTTGERAFLPFAATAGLELSMRAGDHLVFTMLEDGNANAVIDADGDGETEDLYTLILDVRTGRVDVRPFFGLMYVVDELVYYSEYEGFYGVDLTGDGDVDDSLLTFLDPATGTIARSPFGVEPSGSSVYRTYETAVGLAVDESWLGVDLDFDGNTTGLLHAVHDVRTGRITLLPQVFLSSQENAERQLVATVRELDFPVAIGNGDGDSTDTVPVVLDLNLGTVTVVKKAIWLNGRAVSSGSRAFVSVPESDEGASDLNGDGDLLDHVLMSYDTSTGVSASLGVSSSIAEDISGVLVDSTFVYRAVESAQGTDLNGDGDATDVLFVGFDPASGLRTDLELPAAGFRLATLGALQTLVLDESELGDQNSDGDQDDEILFVLGLREG